MENLRYELLDGGIGVLRLSRPKALNALSPDLLVELDGFLRGDLGGANALVVTGDGDRAFAAGADIGAMAGLSASEAEAFARRGQATLTRLEALAVPTIAAVNGFALGGGCELAMACDLVLAGPKALFGQPEVKLGLIPGFGGTQRLVRRIGRQRALEWMWTGRNVSADEAVAAGLALRKVDGDVVVAATDLMRAILANGPQAVRWVKQAVRQTEGVTLERGLDAEASLFGLCFSTADMREGTRAFIEKRPASWAGK